MNMSDLMSQARQFQDKLGKMQDELAEKSVSASAGGGMVNVTVNGRGELTELTIEKELINPDEPQMLHDLVMAAINEGLRKSRELSKSELAGLTGGLNLPGFM